MTNKTKRLKTILREILPESIGILSCTFPDTTHKRAACFLILLADDTTLQLRMNTFQKEATLARDPGALDRIRRCCTDAPRSTWITIDANPIQIGDLAVTAVGTANPYVQGASVLGDGRVAVLRKFARGESLDGYKVWYAPACGGARVLQNNSELEPFDRRRLAEDQ